MQKKKKIVHQLCSLNAYAFRIQPILNRMNNECICINNCPIRCDTNRTTNPDAKDDENNNMVFDNSDENANISELQQMNASRYGILLDEYMRYLNGM